MNLDSENFGFWMKPIKIETPNEKYWAKARIKVDRTTKLQYVDVVCGVKNKNKPHIHAGFEIQTNTPLFFESREMVASVRRELTITEGETSDEKVDLKNTKVDAELKLALKFDKITKEVTITKFEIIPPRVD